MAVCLAAVLFFGCGGGAPATPGTVSVTDALGRTVLLPDSVARIATLAPNLTEIVFAAGAGHRLVGVTTVDDYPPAVDALPRFSALPIDFEMLVSLAPDLVLATDHVNNPGDAATFDALGIPLYFFSFRDLGGMVQSIRTTGRLLGTTAEADRRADRLQTRLDSLQARTSASSIRPLTLVLIGDEILYAFGDESYVHDMIALAGGRSATADFGADMPVLSDEYVLTTRPDVIVGAFGDAYDPARLLALHPTWDIVPAIVHGRVYSIDPDLILRPGPRLVDGTEAIARLLHPDLTAPDAPAVAE